MGLAAVLELLELHRGHGTLSDAVLQALLDEVIPPPYIEPMHLWGQRRQYEERHGLPFGSTGDPRTTGRTSD